eukprot:3172172-Amphidinium_carterae.1
MRTLEAEAAAAAARAREAEAAAALARAKEAETLAAEERAKAAVAKAKWKYGTVPYCQCSLLRGACSQEEGCTLRKADAKEDDFQAALVQAAKDDAPKVAMLEAEESYIEAVHEAKEDSPASSAHANCSETKRPLPTLPWGKGTVATGSNEDAQMLAAELEAEEAEAIWNKIDREAAANAMSLADEEPWREE